MSDEPKKHQYYANAIGFVALCALLAILGRGCANIVIEQERTRQLQITHQVK